MHLCLRLLSFSYLLSFSPLSFLLFFCVFRFSSLSHLQDPYLPLLWPNRNTFKLCFAPLRVSKPDSQTWTGWGGHRPRWGNSNWYLFICAFRCFGSLHLFSFLPSFFFSYCSTVCSLSFLFMVFRSSTWFYFHFIHRSVQSAFHLSFDITFSSSLRLESIPIHSLVRRPRHCDPLSPYSVFCIRSASPGN